MAEEKPVEGEVRVRNVRTPQENNVLGSVMEGGSNVVRMILGVFTLPLSILPANTREQARTTVQDTVKAVASFPGDWANVVSKAVQDWANQEVPSK